MSLLLALVLSQASLNLQAGGVPKGQFTTINCSGAGLTCTRNSSTSGVITVSIVAADGGSVVATYTATKPINISATTISCLPATSTDAGCLAAADFNTFRNGIIAINNRLSDAGIP